MPPELIRLARVQSTMEEAHARAHDGAEHGTTVVAEVQTLGRGTRGRWWWSGEGGLWLSVVARPSRTDALEALSLRIGLAVSAALELAVPALPRLQLKWPNDIVVDARKLGGILCEARWGGGQCQWVVIGLGVNVRNNIPPQLEDRAVRLMTWEPAVTPDPLAAPVAAAIALAAREAGPLTTAELSAFALRDAIAGKSIVEPLAGTAEGITSSGALRVRTDSGPIREVLAGVVSVAG